MYFRRYWFDDALIPWNEAQDFCTSMHPLMSLAEFNDPGEMAAVVPGKATILRKARSCTIDTLERIELLWRLWSK